MNRRLIDTSRPLHDWGSSTLTGMSPTRYTVSKSGSVSCTASSRPDTDSGSRWRWRLTGLSVIQHKKVI